MNFILNKIIRDKADIDTTKQMTTTEFLATTK